MKTYPVIDANGHLASNDIWNVPAAPENEVHGNMKTFGAWSIPVSYRALAMDMHGRVFGVRTMSKPKESGYNLEGRVSVEGKSYRAFTSSKMFRREDGSLCEVAIVYVCGTPGLKWQDPLTVPADGYRDYLNGISSRYHYEREGVYASLARYCTVLESIQFSEYRLTNEWLVAEWNKELVTLRAELLTPMGW